MPNWVHRTNKRYIKSVASADLPEPEANYIQDPDLSAVTGQPSKYWVITGDTVTTADQATRDSIDAQLKSDNFDRIANALDATDNITRAFMLVVLDEINLLRQQHALAERTVSQLRNAIRNKLGS